MTFGEFFQTFEKDNINHRKREIEETLLWSQLKPKQKNWQEYYKKGMLMAKFFNDYR